MVHKISVRKINNYTLSELSALPIQEGISSDSVPDPYVFEPPGSGSLIILYESGSGSFHQQAKNLKP
jgi:hypothetical protein